jgi:hypothetical protein
MGCLAMAAADVTQTVGIALDASRVTSVDARSALRAWRAAYTFLLLVMFATCITVDAIPGAGTPARELLHLKLTGGGNPPPNVALVLSIAANNTLHSVWPLTLGLLDTQARRWTRALADAFVIANLAVPGVLVGAAIATYGTQMLAYLPHVPVEFAGIAAGAAGWLIERGRPLTTRERSIGIGVTVAVLLLAAAIEAYLVPHR